MFSVLIIFFSIQLVLAIVLSWGYYTTKKQVLNHNYKPYSIIIPFKNEIKRILPLLQSINKAAIFHKNNDLFSQIEFIFIDDHSTDHSVNFILDQIDIEYKIIRLRDTFGKKYALKKGVEIARYSKILTLDADVEFDVNYLNSILNIDCCGLCILPVKMQGNNFMQNLFSIEFLFLQQLTFGLVNYKKPILCNGANLLFTKNTFLKTLKIRKDANINSGDDMYLLKAVRNLNLPILTINSNNHQVTTFTPTSLNEMLNQSVRWAKKPQDINGKIGALFIILSNILMVYSIVLIFSDSLIFIIPLLLKLISEFLSSQSVKHLFYIIFHQIYYPIYLLILSVKLILPLPKWR